LTAAKVAEAGGAIVVAVCVVVDRNTGANTVIEAAGYPYRAALQLSDLGL
jgi:orotate phosphoribosyltransferase